MKYIGRMDKLIFGVIILLIITYGVKEGLELAYTSGLMGALMTGFISFAITGVIMAVFNFLFGIWFGKEGGAILFVINCIWIGNIIF